MRKFKLQVLLVALSAIVATLISYESLAFYSVIGTATNVITTGDIKLVIHETSGDGSPYPILLRCRLALRTRLTQALV